MTYNVACIKWGDKYSAQHVNRLFRGVKGKLDGDLKFFCVTDDPVGLDEHVISLPIPDEPFIGVVQRVLAGVRRQGAFRKISLFRPGLINCDGPILGLDLDVAITGSLEKFFSYSPGNVCMRHDWLAARRGRPDGHGSVFRYDPRKHHFLYDEFANDPERMMKISRFSEQKCTSMLAQQRSVFAYFPEPWISSYKRDATRIFPLNHFLQPRRPTEASVVCFHGYPKMEDAVAGYSKGLFRAAKPCKWLEECWVDK